MWASSFRFVGFDAGHPLVRGMSFWGFRSYCSNSMVASHCQAALNAGRHLTNRQKRVRAK